MYSLPRDGQIINPSHYYSSSRAQAYQDAGAGEGGGPAKRARVSSPLEALLQRVDSSPARWVKLQPCCRGSTHPLLGG